MEYKTIIKPLKAGHGDCILIHTYDDIGKQINILIDGGTKKEFENNLLKELKKFDTIDLLILTHIDLDHISGLITLFRHGVFKKIQVKRFWLNFGDLFPVNLGSDVGYSQGNKLVDLLKEKNVESKLIKSNITSDLGMFEMANGINYCLLSPTEVVYKKFLEKWKEIYPTIFKGVEDIETSGTITPSQVDKGTLEKLAATKIKVKSINSDLLNASSLAFVLCTQDMKILLLGDARAEIVIETLKNKGFCSNNKLKVDYVKISHHGSKNNTTNELLDMIDSDHYIISTNGGAKSKHPDREVIAKILLHPERELNRKRFIYFNYSRAKIEEKAGVFITDDEAKDSNAELIFEVNKLPIL